MNEQHLSHTTAALLGASGKLLPYNLLMAALGGWRAEGAVALALWAFFTLATLWQHWRIAFDAAVFRYWAAADSAGERDRRREGFDAALIILGLRRRPPAADLATRCRGAARLCTQLLLLTLLQTLATIIIVGI